MNSSDKMIMLPGQSVWGILQRTCQDLANYKVALKRAGYTISTQADNIMTQQAFMKDFDIESVELVRVSVEVLTNKNQATTAEVLVGAQGLSLRKCPLWVGPEFCTQYTNQPVGGALFIGTKPTADSNGILCMFEVVRARLGGNLHLRTRNAHSDDVWDGRCYGMFCRSVSN